MHLGRTSQDPVSLYMQTGKIARCTLGHGARTSLPIGMGEPNTALEQAAFGRCSARGRYAEICLRRLSINLARGGSG